MTEHHFTIRPPPGYEDEVRSFRNQRKGNKKLRQRLANYKRHVQQRGDGECVCVCVCVWVRPVSRGICEWYECLCCYGNNTDTMKSPKREGCLRTAESGTAARRAAPVRALSQTRKCNAFASCLPICTQACRREELLKAFPFFLCVFSLGKIHFQACAASQESN